MQSESAIDNRTSSRARRRKSGGGPAEGPVFVDSSGRRARLLRRIGMLVGAVCLGYAVVLGMAFMGWGTSLTPSSLLPFGGGPAGTQNSGPGGARPEGGLGTPPALPGGAAPTATGASPSPSVSASTGAN
ncbi:hypothetical protein ACFYP4_24710 [Streptomyces sp. NPDC005551]|uniref:hypothetical protein n=1 Tax=unclassified Streptomyces TaxID=2593676 RepID=UPI0033C47419